MKKPFTIKRKVIVIICLIFSVLMLLIPVFFFINNFKSQNISNSISDWGTFGDFFGGTLNTLISFISLIILGYLTYIVSKQSIEENKKLNILLRKFDAYEKMVLYIPKLNLMSNNLYFFVTMLSIQKDKKFLSNENQNSFTLELSQNFITIIEVYYFLKTFEHMYGHLFKYNFSSDFYVKLLQDGNVLEKNFSDLRVVSLTGDDNYIKFDMKDTEKIYLNFHKNLLIFIDDLKKELH